MEVVSINCRTVDISRYADPAIPSGNLTTTAVAIKTDVIRNGRPVVGYGFSSIGRFGQTGLIEDRFAPRLLKFRTLDPIAAWNSLMADEKPGGHGERCIAVGTLDMALWDAAAKIEDLPLYELLRRQYNTSPTPAATGPVKVYAGGGYYYPANDLQSLRDEIQGFLDSGYKHVKIKIAGRTLSEDLRRIETALSLLGSGNSLAVDAMNRYTLPQALEAARALEPYNLRWFEDPMDPLDFEAHKELGESYAPPLAIGEATFSVPDARNLLRYAGLRSDRDRLIFDPVHCYGLPEFVRIVKLFEAAGWSRKAFYPHGGHLFSLHVAAGLGLGGSEANPNIFQPFGGFSDQSQVINGEIHPPQAPGIGFETKASLKQQLGVFAT
jgi:L-alanine-DL-glutamate epimerase-like enolase superfamily enzyme